MVNVGIIGLGRSGWELHGEPLSKMPDYQVVAVCDQSQARVALIARELGARACSDGQGLIDDTEVDLVVVAAPGRSSNRMIRRAPMEAVTRARSDAGGAVSSGTG